jgi:hypothetical protein
LGVIVGFSYYQLQRNLGTTNLKGPMILFFTTGGCVIAGAFYYKINYKIPAIKNLIFSPFVVNFIVKIPCNNKTPVIKNKIIGFIVPRFLCN